MTRPAPSQRIGAYEIRSLIGSGGMGEVYRARDTSLDRDVAIKILPDAVTADPDGRARFEREARVLAALNHPHIAAIYGFEHGEGVHALVLEFVDGETLAARVRAGALPVRDALVLARQIADALDAAHEKGIVHRDLKPANISITGAGAVKVLDFGLAKVDAGAAGQHHLRARGVHGDHDRLAAERRDSGANHRRARARRHRLQRLRRPERRRAGDSLLRRHAPRDRQGEGHRPRRRRERLRGVTRPRRCRRRSRQTPSDSLTSV